MRVAVTGSIATDHLLRSPGRFTDPFLADRLDEESRTLLADRLEIRRGGVAANISVGLGRLGLRPVLVGAVGGDFEPYRSALRRDGVDTGSVRVSALTHTARYLRTTDRMRRRVSAFRAGAMEQARHLDLGSVVGRVGRLGLVMVSPDDPEAMVRHARACRRLRIPFAVHPAQQLTALGRHETRELIAGAGWLFTNADEAEELCARAGLTRAEILRTTGVWVTTRGADGVRCDRAGHPPLAVPAVPVPGVVCPAGAGDGFRAGFLAALTWRMPHRQAAQLGCALAATVLDYAGTQEYRLYRDCLLTRLRTGYGPEAVLRLVAHLRALT